MTSTYTGMFEQAPVYHIPIEQVALGKRARKELGDVSDLRDDILANSQLQAGVVRDATISDLEDGIDPSVTPYVVVAGGRRYAAVCLAGLDTYKAELYGELSPLRQAIIELHENLKRKNLEWDEEVFLKERIHKLYAEQAALEGQTWTQKDTAKIIGETHANVSRDLSLAQELRANPDLRTAGSKAGAARLASYDKKITERLARVNASGLMHVKERLHTADMKDYVRTLPTHSVDLNFSDFPFGISYNFDPHDKSKYKDEQERLWDLLTDVVPQVIRTTKPTGWAALMMGSTNYEFLKDLMENCCATHFEYRDKDALGPFCACQYIHDRFGIPESDVNMIGECRYLTCEDPEWLWYRPNSRNPSMWPELHAQNQYEKLCVVNMGQAVMVRKNEGNVLVHDAVYEDRLHEMQRPHSLCLDIVSRLSLGGELVCDLCFGSGSALAAAAELQREFIGCDLNPENLASAQAWVTEHYQHRG